jgi:hypothetical protein
MVHTTFAGDEVEKHWHDERAPGGGRPAPAAAGPPRLPPAAGTAADRTVVAVTAAQNSAGVDITVRTGDPDSRVLARVNR